jgi:hypothetical protein
MDHNGTSDDHVDASKLATARRLKVLHQQQTFPEPDICAWCLKRWPCPDRRWAERVLRAGGRGSDGGPDSHL